ELVQDRAGIADDAGRGVVELAVVALVGDGRGAVVAERAAVVEDGRVGTRAVIGDGRAVGVGDRTLVGEGRAVLFGVLGAGGVVVEGAGRGDGVARADAVIHHGRARVVVERATLIDGGWIVREQGAVGVVEGAVEVHHAAVLVLERGRRTVVVDD